jgi:putative PIN family toxin of toxin-antitoxin system
MTARVTKVVFDANILLSGHFWKGPPYRCLLAVDASLVLLVLSEPIISEFKETLEGKFGVPEAEVDAIVERFATRAEIVPVQGRSGWVTQDADDDKFIDAALVSGAAIIVSGDKHLLTLGSIDGIEVVRAREFLDRLPAFADETAP